MTHASVFRRDGWGIRALDWWTMINSKPNDHCIRALTAIAFLIAACVPALALNRKLTAMEPGLYSSGMDGGCSSPDSKDRLLIDRAELHEYETHCKIRKVSPISYFYVLETDCELEGEYGRVTFEIAPVATGTLLIQMRKGPFVQRDDKPTAYHMCP